MRYEFHAGWFSTYMIFLILILMAEFYALGARSDWTFTRNLMAVVEQAPWVGIIVMGFLTWLHLHFAFLIFPIVRDWLR